MAIVSAVAATACSEEPRFQGFPRRRPRAGLLCSGRQPRDARPIGSGDAAREEPAASVGRDGEDHQGGDKGQQGRSVRSPEKVPQSDTVRLVVTTDTAGEAHVHGYDLRRMWRPGKPEPSSSSPSSRTCTRSSSRRPPCSCYSSRSDDLQQDCRSDQSAHRRVTDAVLAVLDVAGIAVFEF